MEPLFEHRQEFAGYDTRVLELEGSGPPLLLLDEFLDEVALARSRRPSTPPRRSSR
jgi:hypothetical protein